MPPEWIKIPSPLTRRSPLHDILRSFVVLLILLLMLMGSATAQWVPADLPFRRAVTPLDVSGTNLFAGTLAGVFRPTNGDARWSWVRPGLPTDISVNPANVGVQTFPFRFLPCKGPSPRTHPYPDDTQVVRKIRR